MKPRHIHTAVALCMIVSMPAALAAPAVAAVEPRHNSRPGLQKLLDRIVAGGAVAAIAEVRDGSTTWRGASGRARIDRPQPARADGRFRAGSVTKSFTATVVLQLVGEGKLELSDSVEQWLPGLVGQGGTITVRNLLQHTSGIPEYATGLFDEDGVLKDRYRTWTARELVERAEEHPHEFPAGTRFGYSNTNYIVLGMLIERVTGRPYASEIRERILRPLGLGHTLLPGTSPEVPGAHPHAYVRVVEGGEVVPVDVTRFNATVAGAAGSIISTTADLNRFYRALLGGELLGPALLKEMKDPGGAMEYGLGLEVASLPCGVAYGHGGGTNGYSTVAFSSPDGTRQLALSMTPYSDDRKRAAMALLTSALCPPQR
ncbi:serine hydrolase domain-containing protein [Microbispora siamensis]|uniref:Serine hydrolase n=1 Tax=Microbispora siamensis TaxID=564413 RepID=A0ABQ4GIJ5_9ACTN|nr:serine hydrolase domain-containing protein [Microbispora siamensis]GIH61241.1 serine hydrolase [Microbispora siamensis]